MQIGVFHLLAQLGTVAMLSLLVAVVPAIMALGYAIWPSESKLALMRPLSLASLFGAFAGFTGGVVNGVLGALSRSQALDSPTIGGMIVGFAEALVPLFVCFGSLTVAWLLVAVGMRRKA